MNGNGSAAKELKRLLGEKNVRTGSGVLSSYFPEPLDGADLTVVMPQSVDHLSDVAAFSYENAATSDRWSTDCGITTVRSAPSSGSGKYEESTPEPVRTFFSPSNLFSSFAALPLPFISSSRS